MSSSLIQIRIDDDLKNDSAALYDALGLDLPTAIRMFLKRSVMMQGIPFSMVLPEKEYPVTSAVYAMRAISSQAKENGTADISLDEINEEIDAVRRKHKIAGDNAL